MKRSQGLTPLRYKAVKLSIFGIHSCSRLRDSINLATSNAVSVSIACLTSTSCSSQYIGVDCYSDIISFLAESNPVNHLLGTIELVFCYDVPGSVLTNDVLFLNLKKFHFTDAILNNLLLCQSFPFLTRRRIITVE